MRHDTAAPNAVKPFWLADRVGRQFHLQKNRLSDDCALAYCKEPESRTKAGPGNIATAMSSTYLGNE